MKNATQSIVRTTRSIALVAILAASTVLTGCTANGTPDAPEAYSASGSGGALAQEHTAQGSGGALREITFPTQGVTVPMEAGSVNLPGKAASVQLPLAGGSVNTPVMAIPDAPSGVQAAETRLYLNGQGSISVRSMSLYEDVSSGNPRPLSATEAWEVIEPGTDFGGLASQTRIISLDGEGVGAGLLADAPSIGEQFILGGTVYEVRDVYRTDRSNLGGGDSVWGKSPKAVIAVYYPTASGSIETLIVIGKETSRVAS